jgi:hypothetical protein
VTLSKAWEALRQGIEDLASILSSFLKRRENPQGVRRDFKGAKRLLKSKCRFEESGMKL